MSFSGGSHNAFPPGGVVDAARAAANDERVKQVLGTAGSPIQHFDAPEFQRYVDADAAKMADVVKRIGKVE
ncbi:MAG: hypothetical protein ABI777_04325 [Betaproteobacteria bacterium]